MADGFVQLDIKALQTTEGLVELNRMLQLLFDLVAGDGDNVRIYHCYGTPESQISASPGSLALRKDGGASTTLYVKTSGTGSTGWTAK